MLLQEVKNIVTMLKKVFFDKGKAEEYCKPFNEDENSYHRDITKIEVLL